MEIYKIVSERIINLPEQIMPWRRPPIATGLARNLVSKKSYRGVSPHLILRGTCLSG